MTQTNFKDLITKASTELESKSKKRRSFSGFSGEEFKELFLIRANTELRKRKSYVDFVMDDDNKTLVNQLFYYMVKSELFAGDLEKGILVLGNLGSGKSIIMQTFCQVWEDLSTFRIRSVTAKKYAQSLNNPEVLRNKEGYVMDCIDGILFIDDLGKEAKKVVVYGTEICPIADLFAERYDKGRLTFATGNYTLETLKSHYGETITDRMKEMFNIIVLKGDSRRK